jgi:hypothetical protein
VKGGQGLTYLIAVLGSLGAEPVLAQSDLDLPPEVWDSSPLLQRWVEEIPDVLTDIQEEPSFRPLVRLGYTYFPKPGARSGLGLGAEDLFLERRQPWSLSADYQTSFGAQQSGGVEGQYYLLPLGYKVNFTPLVGYRFLQSELDTVQGLSLGMKLRVSLSSTGAADLRLSQQFVAPASNREGGVTTLSLGYALTPSWRLAVTLQQQNSPAQKNNSAGLYIEFLN